MVVEQPVSAHPYYAARPILRIDQQENAMADANLRALEVNEQEGGLSSLEMRFLNIASREDGSADFAFEDDRVLKLGAAVGVYSGEEVQPREIFRGTITGLEAIFSEVGPPEIVAMAEDALQQARMARRTLIYEDLSPGDLANEIASNLGLRAAVTGLNETQDIFAQLNESDLAFLRRVLARYDADLQIVGDELHVSPRQDVQRGTLTLEIHSQLREVRVLADLAHQVTEVHVAGWDVASGSAVEGTGGGSPQGPGQGSAGREIIQRAFDGRVHRMSHLAARNQAEANAIARAAYEQRARRFVRLLGTTEGNAQLRVGTHVTVRGLGRFDNTYYVTQAMHRWDLERGYETDFEAECAFWGGQ